MSLVQNRVSPKKVFFLGFFQPIFDGLKLIFNELILILKVDFFIYVFFPYLLFFLLLFLFYFLDYLFFFNNLNLTLIFFLVIFNSFIYFFCLRAYFRKSKFSFLGSLRFVNQNLSFDIIFFFVILIFVFFLKKFIFKINFFFFWLILLLFLILILIDLNRSPFDFSEGERELVRGFNLEFGSILFTFLFLTEYGFILFFSLFLDLFWGGLNILFLILLIFIFLGIRFVYPRFRYDLLISLCWFFFTPLVLFFFIFYFFSL